MKRKLFTLQILILAVLFTAGSAFSQRNMHQAAVTQDGKAVRGHVPAPKNTFQPGNFMKSILFSEDWSSGDLGDWTIDGEGADNWYVSESNYAGGASPELEMYYYPLFTGTSRMVSPVINTTGYTSLSLGFQHLVDPYLGGYWVSVETTSDGGATWNLVWELYMEEGADNYGPIYETLIVSTEDVGSDGFQFCFKFEDNSDNMDFWEIDDISLGEASALDAGVLSLSGINDVNAIGAEIAVTSVVKNYGSDAATFDVELVINDGSSDVFTTTETVTDLAGGSNESISFDAWTSTGEGVFTATATTYLTGDANPDNDYMSYTFSVIDGITRNLVVMEDFTGTWCVFCPGAAMGIEDLIENGYSIGPIGYHVSDTYETVESAARATYYNVPGYPTNWFDGVYEYVGGNATTSLYESYVPIVEDRMAVPTAIDVTIEDAAFDGTTFTANVLCEAVSAVASENLVLQAVLTESHIDEAWMVMYEVNDAERLMYNGENGTEIDLIGNTSETVSIEFELDPSWIPEMCEVVVFVQDLSTKEIFNGNKTNVKEIESFGSVTIEVTTPDNDPIEDATVYFDELTGTTGTDGMITFEEVEPGVHWYNADKEGCLPSGQSHLVMQAADKMLSLQMVKGTLLSTVDFAGTFPPEGWTLEGDYLNNWQQAESNMAGGIAPELNFHWSSDPVLTSECISPVFDFTGSEKIYLMFKHLVNDYSGTDYALYVMATADGENWETLWSMETPYDMPATVELFDLGEQYIEAGSVQVKFSYQGDPYQIDDWFIDDVWIVEPALSTGVKDYKAESVRIYPNPAKGSVTLSSNSRINRVRIYSLYGQLVNEVEVNANTVNISTTGMQTGVYLFKIETEEGSLIESVIVE